MSLNNNNNKKHKAMRMNGFLSNYLIFGHIQSANVGKNAVYSLESHTKRK